MDTENTQATIKQKQRQRKAKALRSLLIRTTLLVVILYVLLFHIVGLTAMKNGVIVDYDITEALNMERVFDKKLYEIAHTISI